MIRTMLNWREAVLEVMGLDQVEYIRAPIVHVVSDSDSNETSANFRTLSSFTLSGRRNKRTSMGDVPESPSDPDSDMPLTAPTHACALELCHKI